MYTYLYRVIVRGSISLLKIFKRSGRTHKTLRATGCCALRRISVIYLEREGKTKRIIATRYNEQQGNNNSRPESGP